MQVVKPEGMPWGNESSHARQLPLRLPPAVDLVIPEADNADVDRHETEELLHGETVTEALIVYSFESVLRIKSVARAVDGRLAASPRREEYRGI